MLMPTSSQADGLSPRLRGSGPALGIQPAGVRVIPAPAGIGLLVGIFLLLASGYPRACGDRILPETPLAVSGGLSPRLRGSAGPDAALPRGDRVIPAPAGIGRPEGLDAAPRPGYPRACGDRLSTDPEAL